MYFLLALLVIIIIIAVKSIKVVRQSEVYIIERLGRFHKVADAGLTIIIPFFDHVRSVVSLKQQTMDVPPQGVITKDNVTINKAIQFITYKAIKIYFTICIFTAPFWYLS